ncbi:MAG TPA: maleylpyruvate isomerase N-terminal domain-containing protein [Candidatus Limnocylindria bacterium]|nr:maleylpyruvate isomerase N-terminal domain-containing protein [Candidatus Limnocylindria bacterium]
MGREALIADLQRERDGLFEALGSVSEESMTTPGLVGEWSGRELIAHVGYWCGHATQVIHLFEQGRIEEDDLGGQTVDEVNETVARIARDTPLATVRRREAASVQALVERLRTLDEGLLPALLRDGATLEEGLREDGSDHYREHAEQLRAALSDPADA